MQRFDVRDLMVTVLPEDVAAEDCEGGRTACGEITTPPCDGRTDCGEMTGPPCDGRTDCGEMTGPPCDGRTDCGEVTDPPCDDRTACTEASMSRKAGDADYRALSADLERLLGV